MVAPRAACVVVLLSICLSAVLGTLPGKYRNKLPGTHHYERLGTHRHRLPDTHRHRPPKLPGTNHRPPKLPGTNHRPPRLPGTHHHEPITRHEIRYGHHNITHGHRRLRPFYPQSDMLLFHENRRLPALNVSFVSNVQSRDVCYPFTASHPKFSITAFNVTDLMPRGDGGYAFIDKGGVGSSKLCLHLQSQARKGYNFTIDIWGFYIHNVGHSLPSSFTNVCISMTIYVIFRALSIGG